MTPALRTPPAGGTCLRSKAASRAVTCARSVSIGVSIPPGSHAVVRGSRTSTCGPPSAGAVTVPPSAATTARAIHKPSPVP
ncbi:hypothetical protein ACFQ0B_39850 [Nonomuraea thailandensis]